MRAEGSQIWATWNPESKDDPIDEFLRGEFASDDSIVIEVNINNNPFAPQTYLMNTKRIVNALFGCKLRVMHGPCSNTCGMVHLEFSQAIIFCGRYVVDEFEPDVDWTEVYYGSDWGFSQDSTTLNYIFIHNDILYIRNEAHQAGCEIDHLPNLFDEVPGARIHKIRADNS
jgi:phage terminase large subunit